jgi:16S rRNA (uracil1498-N3)-methyltransferase
MIGSEGGFSPAEAQAAIEAGMIPVGLGRRILRTETASAFALSCLVYEWEL